MKTIPTHSLLRLITRNIILISLCFFSWTVEQVFAGDYYLLYEFHSSRYYKGGRSDNMHFDTNIGTLSYSGRHVIEGVLDFFMKKVYKCTPNGYEFVSNQGPHGKAPNITSDDMSHLITGVLEDLPPCGDNCPNDPNKTDPGQCGCGNPETDSDGDLIPDCIDGCPHDPNKTDAGECELDEAKNQGDCDGCPCPTAGNPINFSTGNKYQRELDLTLESPGLPMGYTRYYNSQSELNSTLGHGWTGSFSERFTFETGKIILREADGKEVHFIDDGHGKYVSEADKFRTIEFATVGYELVGQMMTSHQETHRMFL